MIRRPGEDRGCSTNTVLKGVVTIFNILSISPVGIGISGKMFVKSFVTSKKFPKYLNFFKDWNFTPFGCPWQPNFTSFWRPRQPNFTPFWCPWQPNFTQLSVLDNCFSGPGLAGRICSLSFYSIWLSLTTKIYFILASPTTKFYSVLVSLTTKCYSIGCPQQLF